MIMNADGTYGKNHKVNNNSHNKHRNYHNYSNFEEAEYYIDKLASLHISRYNEKKAINYLSQSHVDNEDRNYLIKLIRQGNYDGASIGMAEIADHA